MHVRRATLDDIDRWCQMRFELWPTSTFAQHEEEILNFFDGDSRDIAEVFVIETRRDKPSVQPLGQTIGFLEINIRNYAEGSDNDRVPYVEGWFIEEDFRGKGWGSRLMEVVENWARDLGYSELASDTTVENAGSIRLHKKLGFKEQERVVCFLKSLKK